jgi:carbon-monoxide dehydrogenase iron sulfur subunit
MACPYGAVQRNLTFKKANKCDLCPDRETPACVSACPNRALVFEEGNKQ